MVSELEKIKIFNTIKRHVFKIGIVEDAKGKVYVYDDSFKIMEFTSQGDYLTGFNIIGYDNVLIKAIHYLTINNVKVKDFNRKLYELSKLIVETYDRSVLWTNQDYIDYVRYPVNFQSIDLQRIPALDKVMKGLKQTLINIKWHNIQEFKLPPINDMDSRFYSQFTLDLVKAGNKDVIKDWDRIIIKEYIRDIIAYNYNDVLGCCDLFRVLMADINLRFDITNEYNINVLSASQSSIADIFIAKYYSDYTGVPYKDFKNLRTYRNGGISVASVLNPLISFKTDECNKILNTFKNMRVYTTKDIELKFTFNNVTYKFGSGGLHSVVRRNSGLVSVIPPLSVNHSS